MKDKILCVDDEPAVLQAQKRLLHKHFEIHTAESGSRGLAIIKEKSPFAVIISDMQMPGMNGIEFLSEAKQADPEAVRMMLTGDQDLSTAENAVNEGNIFRFLRKPCPPETIAKAIKAALHQYHLVIAEKELLEKTLNQTISVLVDLLGLANPQAFSRASRLQSLFKQLTQKMDLRYLWKYDVATMLSQLGCISMPEEVLVKESRGEDLSAEEERLYRSHPSLGYEQVVKIPRMEEVAGIIKYQEKGFDGSLFPPDSLKGEDLPLASRILKAAIDFDKHQVRGASPQAALKHLQNHSHLYDPQVLAALEEVVKGEIEYVRQEVKVSELKDRMILAEDIKAETGVILARKNQEINKTNARRLYSFSVHTKIKEPIKVLIAQS